MTNFIWLFDRYGTPVLQLYNDGRFVDRHGRFVGVLSENNTVFNYNGKHKGWYEKGVLRDLKGFTTAFAKGASDSPSPIFPIPQIPPVPAIPAIPPVPAIHQIPNLKPINKT